MDVNWKMRVSGCVCVSEWVSVYGLPFINKIATSLFRLKDLSPGGKKTRGRIHRKREKSKISGAEMNREQKKVVRWGLKNWNRNDGCTRFVGKIVCYKKASERERDENDLNWNILTKKRKQNPSNLQQLRRLMGDKNRTKQTTKEEEKEEGEESVCVVKAML